MFKKNQRLSRSEFSQYFKVGKKHNSPLFTIITHPHPTIKTVVVVGKKVSKSAVKRNAIRRRVYASLRNVLVEGGCSGVFIVIVKPEYVHKNKKAADELFITSIAQVVKQK